MNAVIISVVIFIFTLLLAALGGLLGYLKGAAQQGVRFGTVVISVLLAFLATKIVCSIVTSFVDGLDVLESLDMIGINTEELGWLASADISIVSYILAMPIALLILPVAFVPFFILFFLLTLIASKIICSKTGLKDQEKTVGMRIGGVALGVIQGIVVSAMILLPVVGISSQAEDTMDVIEKTADESEATTEVVEAYDEFIAPLTEGFSIKTLSFFGGDLMYDLVSNVSVNGRSIDMTDILPDAASIYANLLECEGMDWMSLTPENEQAIRSMVATFKSDELFTVVSAEVVRSFAVALADGQAVMELEPPFDKIMSEAALAFTATNEDTIGEDLDTLTSVYFTLSRDGFFVAMAGDEASDEMLEILTKKDENGKTTVNKIIEILRANKRTENLVHLISKLSVAVMAKNIDLGEDFEVVYESVKDGINETLAITKEGKTDEEYVAEVSDSIDTILKQNNITVEKGIVDEMANFVNENFEAGTEITDDDVSDIIISYYDAYLEYLANGGEEFIPEDMLPEGVNPEDFLPEGGNATSVPTP